MSKAYHELPDEAHTASTEPLAADFSFNDSEPPPEADFTGTGGRFRKGHDPRRHTFTPAECSEGFWAGLASYVERGGEARNFLKRKRNARAILHGHAEERPRPTRRVT
jgi:hypothetical protein